MFDWSKVPLLPKSIYSHTHTCLAAAEVTLVSSVEQDGRTAACPGEVVTFTCTVTQGAFLNWASSAFTSCDSNPTYTLRSDSSVGSTSVCSSFQANLTAITNITQVGQALQADLTSTLSPTTTMSPGTVITCSDLPSTQSSSPSRMYPNTASTLACNSQSLMCFKYLPLSMCLQACHLLLKAQILPQFRLVPIISLL